MKNRPPQHRKAALPNIALLLVALLCLLLPAMPTRAAVAVYAPAQTPITAADITRQSDADLARLTGRKMGAREKIMFRLIKKKLRKALDLHPELAQKDLRAPLNPDCATITLINGEDIAADIISLDRTSVRYRPCGQPASPEMSYELRDVASIRAANGELVYQSSQKEVYADTNSGAVRPLKNDPYAVVALVCAILGVVVFPPLLILGIILGFASLSRMRRYPDRYKGRGLARAAIIIGLAAVVLALLLIALVFAAFGF